ncbi:MAG: GDP-mannose 4,6-dehydratase [Phycisphaerales bacterium]|nr:GDP-mannose 4,6-dehydratase [Phycisphaerales bacterium]
MRDARRVLVTGGAGFIGSHLTDLLLARGDHVTVIDDLSTGRRANLPASHPRLDFRHEDLGRALGALPRGVAFDQVYHLAAAVGVRLVMDEPVRSIETNIEQTAALLRHIAASPCPTLIASSSEVYGKSAKSPFQEDDDAVYGPTVVGRWSYACSKAVDEYLGLAYHRMHAVPVVIARFFNTVGPRQVGDYGMVLPRFVTAALAGRDLTIHGDGRQSRCFCDVRDVVNVLPAMLDTAACRGHVVNVGSDVPITIADLASLVIRVLGSRSGTRAIPYSEAYPTGFEDLARRQPDLTRLRAAVGFKPSIPLERTILDLAAAIQEAPA